MNYYQNIGILLTKDNPFISKYLFHLSKLNFKNIFLIYDIKKLYTKKNQRLFYLYFEKNVKEVKSFTNKYFKYETSYYQIFDYPWPHWK